MDLINFGEVNFNVFIKAVTPVSSFVNMSICISDHIVPVFHMCLVYELFEHGVSNAIFARL
eukprot:14867277-Heterocapsa_arctica.AAC.1